MRDLSTGRETPVSPVTLKPFELRSFLIPGEAVPVWKSTAVPDAYRRETEAAFAELADGVAGSPPKPATRNSSPNGWNAAARC